MNSKKSVLLISVAICLMAAPITMAQRRGHSSASFSRANFSDARPSFTGSRSGFAAPRTNFSASQPGSTASRSGFTAPRTNFSRQARSQFSRDSGAVSGNWRGRGNHHGRRHGHHCRHHHRSHNVYFSGFGFPYYGYGWGYPGYGYPYYAEYYPSDDGAVYQGQDVSLVLQVQRRLARAGYYRGAIDGVIGRGTRSAIRAYERSHRLPVNGVIDDDLLARMGLS